MPATPVFVADRATLVSRLRLSGVTATDTEQIIDTAMLTARIGFFDNLGADRVAEIQALTVVDANAPNTADEIMRVRAEICEIKWVKMLLLRALPNQFMDSMGGQLQTWNEEGIIRDDPEKREQQIRSLWEEIIDCLTDLKSDTANPGMISSNCLGPEETTWIASSIASTSTNNAAPSD